MINLLQIVKRICFTKKRHKNLVLFLWLNPLILVHLRLKLLYGL
jgi:hypothetical protein